MNILHIDLERTGDLLYYHYFWNSSEQLKTCRISHQPPEIDLANPADSGASLYQWLNGSDCILDREIQVFQEDSCMIAIYCGREFSLLPWELLHDGHNFLINRKPALLAVRCYKTSSPREELPLLPAGRLNVFLLSRGQWLPLLENSKLEITKGDLIDQLWQSPQTREKNYYDLIHLSGDVSLQNEQICFGDSLNPTQIAEKLKYSFPKLLLLSGNWENTDLASFLAEELLKCGAQAILTIKENQDTFNTLYLQLAKGNSLLDCLVASHQQGNPHEIRLHVMGNLPIYLVNRTLISDAYALSRQSLLESQQALTIASKAQRGIMIGDPNSQSIASGLAKLLPNHQQIICSRRLSSSDIVENLTKFIKVEYDKSIDFKYQLRDIFRQSINNCYLFIFYEFEWNLNFKNDKYSLKIETEEILKSLLWAIREGSFAHRIILASHYEFNTNLAHSFYLLSSLGKSSLDSSLTTIDPEIHNILRHCAVYEMAVPISALECVCKDLSNYQNNIFKAIDQGLLELVDFPEQLYSVASVLPQLVPSLQLNKESDFYYHLSRKAATILFQLWLNRENEDTQKWHELFRLALADKSNSGRFKETFLAMLSVQYNAQADVAFEQELRQLREQSTPSALLVQLEGYLQQSDYRQADIETAWIFYQIMILARSRGFKELHEQIPCGLLLQIDELWVQYSNGIFGFSKQNEIFNQIIHLEKYSKDEVWEHFGQEIGWKQGDQWLDYDSLSFNLEAKPANLPALYTTGAYAGGWGTLGSGLGWNQSWVLARRLSSLFGKLARCKS